MTNKLLIAGFLSLLLASTAGAAITVTIELPTPDQVVGPGPDVRAAVTSDFSLQSVVATIGDRSTNLTLASGKWVGWVNISGLARGTHTLTVTATDVQAGSGSAQRNIFLDYYPVVQVTSPIRYSVGRPNVRFTATCTDDDPNGCATLGIALGKNLTTVYNSPNPSSLDTDIAAGQTYRVVGTDSAGRNAIVEVPTILENYGRLRTIANAPSVIRDYDGARLLFNDPYNNLQMGIYDIGTNSIDPMNSTAQTEAARAFLTPAGAIFQSGSNLYEWRSGAMLGPVANAGDLRVQGPFASFTQGASVYRRDLNTGSDTLIGAGSDPDPDANGRVAYVSSADLYLYDGTSSNLLDGGSDWQLAPKTAGGDVLYWRQGPALGSPGAWWIHNGSSAFPITSSFAGSAFGGDIAGDWAVVPVPDISNKRQLRRRAPGSTSSSQATVFNFDHLLNKLAPSGEFIYEAFEGQFPGHWLNGTGLDSAAVPVTGNDRLDGVFHINAKWYVAEGRMLFQLETPNDEISGDHRSDVLWRDTGSGQLEYWKMYGASPDTYSFLPVIPAPWTAQTGDFNGDTRADILWRNPTTAQTSIWFMNGGIIGGANLPNLPSFWQSYPGDYNGDGTDDLLLRNTSDGQVSIWLLQNGVIVAGGNLPSLPLPWKIHPGDFNADGKTDVMLENPSTANNSIWFLSGTAIIGGKTLPNIGSPWEAYAGNFNADAHHDILWRNTSTGDSSVWLMQYGNIIAGGDLPYMPTSAIPYRGDFNGDFKTDLMWWPVTNINGVYIMMMNGAQVLSQHVAPRAPSYEILNLR